MTILFFQSVSIFTREEIVSCQRGYKAYQILVSYWLGLLPPMDFCEAIQNPKHPEHKSMLEWIGGGFDPAEFNLEEINHALKQIK